MPVGEQFTHLLCNGAADFHHQPAPWFQDFVSLGNEALDHFGSLMSGEHGVARLEFADIELYGVFFRFADVRRVGDDEVERVWAEAGEEVSFMKSNSEFKFKAGSIGAGNFERRGRDVDGSNFGVR